jgi:hypothetical protein
MIDTVLGSGIKELIAVLTPYHPGIAFCVPAALRHGPAPGEIRELVSVNLMMRWAGTDVRGPLHRRPGAGD